MAASLLVTGRSAGLSEGDATGAQRAFVVAMEPRVGTLTDDHHPAYLHPGRSMLVLLRDVGPVSLRALMVAAVHESRDPDLRARDDVVASTLGDEVRAARSDLPLPGSERLMERLVGLDPDLLLAVLAERLDHLRHLHLYDDRSAWTATHEEVAAIWLPVAGRAHPKLATRFGHWVRTFARRLSRETP